MPTREDIQRIRTQQGRALPARTQINRAARMPITTNTRRTRGEFRDTEMTVGGRTPTELQAVGTSRIQNTRRTRGEFRDTEMPIGGGTQTELQAVGTSRTQNTRRTRGEFRDTEMNIGGRTQTEVQAVDTFRTQDTRRNRNNDIRNTRAESARTIRTQASGIDETAATLPEQRQTAATLPEQRQTVAGGRSNSNFAIVPMNVEQTGGRTSTNRRPVLAIVPIDNNAQPADFVNFARTIPRSVLQQAR
ncbi:Hypothetical predicted protein [Mytilus galloprovincialis]|uniref:Uncharacterized protein n=1 Tax=Mytilus galloprovincialis TaxID=29158 RepID=A0A8B6H851_MYTGA|nr:Hypothetical predicted protein [Mytilus galloprovincialis]